MYMKQPKCFFIHIFEGILFPGSREVFLGTLPRVPGSTCLPGWVFTFPETEFALLGKLTRNVRDIDEAYTLSPEREETNFLSLPRVTSCI
jgi:hypothetical protein